jgi:hypothetical protein
MKSDEHTEHLVDAIDGTSADTEKRHFEQALRGDPALMAKLDQWRDLTSRLRHLPELEEPLDFTPQVMQRIAAINPPWWIRIKYFLTRKHEFRISLIGALAAATASLAALTLSINLLLPSTAADKPPTDQPVPYYLMRFSYNDPEAKQVYVAGSFNNWHKEQIPLTDSTGNGLWVGALPIKPGLYEYMFYVDGKWVTDDRAGRFKDDGFGRKNAILQLGPQDDIAI